jgi:hypothetical protein
LSARRLEETISGAAPAGQTPAERQASGAQALSAHEALCRRCGKCCYRKVILGGRAVITPFPCQYLDTATNTCTVYERRHAVNPRCLSVAEGLKHSAFPADCPYVALLAPPDYQPAVEQWDWAGQWHEFDQLADELGVPAGVREKVRARGPHAPPLWAETRERCAAGGT